VVELTSADAIRSVANAIARRTRRVGRMRSSDGTFGDMCTRHHCAT
jgi:hypothetical protein